MIFICEDQFFAQSDILSDRHFEKSYCTTCDCAGSADAAPAGDGHRRPLCFQYGEAAFGGTPGTEVRQQRTALRRRRPVLRQSKGRSEGVPGRQRPSRIKGLRRHRRRRLR